jgi:agmatinase
MVVPGVSFKEAKASFEEAHFVIVGVPFDSTTSIRSGTRAAPNAVREASYNLESYLFEHDTNLEDIPIHDAGNIEPCSTMEEMAKATKAEAKSIVSAGKFPIFIGGEHSISIPVIESFNDIGVISIDAHLDFRDEYMGNKMSHACVMRRAADYLGIENVLPFGVRSISAEEKKQRMPNYIDAYQIHEQGIETSWKRAMNILRKEKVYFSLDIDGIDPAYAPGTATPEPFGLSSYDVKKCINMLGERMVGFDVTEISPPYDHGITAALGARMIQEVICVVWKHSDNK